MFIACLAVVAVCQATALRPEQRRASVSMRISSVGDVMSTVSSSSDSLVALNAAIGTLHGVLAETGNATDHISGDDATILRSVISLVEKTIYSSMDQSHDADVDALAAAVGTATQCNTDIVQRQSPGGDLGTLQQHVKDKQAELDTLQGVVDVKTDANNTKWDALDTHMQQISTPPACPGLPAKTMPALDVFFERSEYSIWYTFQQASYSRVRDAFKDADSALQDAVDAYDIQKAVRDQQYCDWKAELEAACDTFEQCFKDASDSFTNTLVPRVTSRMENRIEVKTAGDTLIHQIKFLLAEVDDQQTPPTDTSRFDIAFPVLPSKGICDMTPLSSEEWVPTPVCEAEATIVWKLGAPGGNCDQTCTVGGEFCAGDQDWYGWPESAEEIIEVAQKAGLECTSTAERCDMGESPLFSDGKCYWCQTTGNAQRESYMPRCRNRFGSRTRLCPCQQMA